MSAASVDIDDGIETPRSVSEARSRFQSPDTIAKEEKCHICSNTVYPVNRINIGVSYHRGCFRCATCNVQLDVKSYKRNPRERKDFTVYCRSHQPTLVQRNSYLGPVKQLRTHEEYERHGVFEAQAELERRQVEEEQSLKRSFEDRKTEEINKLKADLEEKRRQSVKELIALFEKINLTDDQRQEKMRDLKEKMAQEYENRYRELVTKLNREKTSKVSVLVDKHSQEMLGLIKSREIEIHRRQNLGTSSDQEGATATTADNLAQTQKYNKPMDIEIISRQSVEVAATLSQEPRKIFVSDTTAATDEKYLYGQPVTDLNQNFNDVTSNEQHGETNIENVNRESDESDEKDIKMTLYLDELIPEALPPSINNAEIWNLCRESFGNIDKQVIKIVKDNDDGSGWTELMSKLTVNCRDDYQRLRAIFRWITLKDLNQLSREDSRYNRADSPWGLLFEIREGSASYHELFKKMCSYAGIACTVITGISKGFGYRPGMKLSPNPRDGSINMSSSEANFDDSIAPGKFQNAWTAAHAEGNWHLVNCNWGARHWKTKEVEREPTSLNYQHDEFYFMTDPTKHIYEHFPDDPKWQLMRHKIEFETFVAIPLAKSPFFNNGLYFPSDNTTEQSDSETSASALLPTYPSGCLRTTTGLVELSVGKPYNVRDALTFGTVLERRDSASGETHRIPNRSIFYLTAERVHIVACLPSIGEYILYLYVSRNESDGDEQKADDLSASSALTSSALTSSAGSATKQALDLACSYQVLASGEPHSAYANVAFREFTRIGATKNFHALGMHLPDNQDVAFVEIADAEHTIIIESSKDKPVKSAHSVKFLHCDENREVKRVPMDSYAMPTERTAARCVYTVRLPKAGFYLFTLYAGSSDEKKDLGSVYKRLIRSTTTHPDLQAFPYVSTSFSDAQLISPKTASLTKMTHHFEIQTEQYFDVALVMGDDWHHLDRTKDVWSKDVNLSDASEQTACIYVRNSEENDNFKPIIRYTIKHD